MTESRQALGIRNARLRAGDLVAPAGAVGTQVADGLAMSVNPLLFPSFTRAKRHRGYFAADLPDSLLILDGPPRRDRSGRTYLTRPTGCS